MARVRRHSAVCLYCFFEMSGSSVAEIEDKVRHHRKVCSGKISTDKLTM